ncbi:hypothetical protein PTTG_28621 [Puccinia triticina 1-1 BBBD Race 1]|uniref:Uncharacterized protein n=2 Tax=Puccinia triticina TaxID=208348 RepID=A0A180GAE2_PUCT1|nr:uncharacterized protein PtA15_3A21 [Puccinia triticina]OAV89641.1 hypothetical protein PTTG_28621 [Puccinia triticina 1-1 BBBD Race 1]WAQ82658.1 hypothetical protein PtA15_3A21 [Puccinia triticina]WAR53507.1 hypothetical protein PtB15_3B15 [Puccinia triticina]
MAFLLTQTLPASNVAMEMSLTKQIEKTKELPQAREVIAVPEVNYEEIKKGYKDSAERLILLGYGGVFGPKRDRLFGPDLYDSGVIEPLTKLAANPKNKVWIITARHWDELPNSISTIPGLHVGHSRGTRLDVPEGRIVPKLPEYAEEMAKMEDQLTKVLSSGYLKFLENDYM